MSPYRSTDPRPTHPFGEIVQGRYRGALSPSDLRRWQRRRGVSHEAIPMPFCRDTGQRIVHHHVRLGDHGAIGETLDEALYLLHHSILSHDVRPRWRLALARFLGRI